MKTLHWKKILKKISFSVFLCLALLLQTYSLPKAQTTGPARLSFTPTSQTLVGANRTGTINAYLTPNGAAVYSVELVITFNKNVVRVDSVSPGAFFTSPGVGTPQEIIKNIDNTNGQIYYAVSFPLQIGGNVYTSTTANAVANIGFTTLAAGTSNFNYVTTGAPYTKVINGQVQNVLGSVTAGSVVVSTGTTPTVTPRPSSTVTPRPTNTVTPRPSSTATPPPSATTTPRPSTTLSPTPPVTTGAILSFTPTSQTVNGLSRTGIINAYLKPQNEKVNSVELLITFNKNVLRVDDITPGPFFTAAGAGTPVEITKNIDNTNGTIYYAVAFPTGSGFFSTSQNIAAVVSFTTLSAGTSNFNYVTTGHPYTKVLDINVQDVLSASTPGSVVVTTTNVTQTPTPPGTGTPRLTATPRPTGPTPTPGGDNCKDTGGDDDDDDDRDDDDDDDDSYLWQNNPFVSEVVAASTSKWKNIPFVNKSGKFRVRFTATPTKHADSYVGLSNGYTKYYPNLTAIVYFSKDGKILARNGKEYKATQKVNYELGKTYHFKALVDVNGQVYSVYVITPSGKEIQIAKGFTFRTEGKHTKSLNNMGLIAKSHAKVLRVCDVEVDDDDEGGSGGGTIPTSTPGPTATPRPTATPGPNPTPAACVPSNGDADGDGNVTLDDYSIWNLNYNSVTANGPFDGDFDCSTVVDGRDYVIWLLAYRGAPPPPTGQGTNLSFTPPSQTLSAGAQGTVKVNLNPNGKQIYSAELVITFNPAVIRIDSIAPGSFFTGGGTPQEIIKNIDNNNGQIYYAVSFPLASGSLHTSSTAGSVADISFTALADGGSALTLVTTGAPYTKVIDANVQNVLDSVTPGMITVGATNASITPTISATNELSISVCEPSNGPFSLNIDNNYFPLRVGMTQTVQSTSEKVVATVLSDTKVVNGVTTRVLKEDETDSQGRQTEISLNYFAQAPDGTVCYFGEDVDEYDTGTGQVVGHGGTWHAGVNGAKAGIMMPPNPQIGQTYYQEIAPQDGAVDRASHDHWEPNYNTPIGVLHDVLYVVESPLSTKRYAPGIGMVYDDGAVITNNQ